MVTCTEKEELGLPEPVIVSLEESDHPSVGSDDAPVRLVIFTDFECGYCKDFSDNVASLKKDYVGGGKVRLVIRNFPLEMHSNAFQAAICSTCAGEQGSFWEMYDTLYKNQSILSDENYIKWADELDLDTVQFKSCMLSDEVRNQTNSDLADGRKIGITGTPAFIINNEMYIGAPDEELLRRMLDDAIERSK
jgi:protein-disulfide isomerase